MVDVGVLVGDAVSVAARVEVFVVVGWGGSVFVEENVKVGVNVRLMRGLQEARNIMIVARTAFRKFRRGSLFLIWFLPEKRIMISIVVVGKPRKCLGVGNTQSQEHIRNFHRIPHIRYMLCGLLSILSWKLIISHEII